MIMNSCYYLLRLALALFFLTGSLSEGRAIFGELGDELNGNMNATLSAIAECYVV